jgi:PAS domain-containing protein
MQDDLVGLWSWDRETGKYFIDSAMGELYEFEPDRHKSGATASDFLGVLHPDDIVRVENAFRAAIETGGPLLLKYRLVRTDGAECWIEVRGETRAGIDGYPTHFWGYSKIVQFSDGQAQTRKEETEIHLRKARRLAKNAGLNLTAHLVETALASLDHAHSAEHKEQTQS